MGRRELFRIEMKVEVEYKDFNQFYREYTKNISKGGIFIRTTNMLKPQTVVEVVLKLPEREKPFVLAGEVVHTLDPETAKAHGWEPGLGIHFLDFKEGAAQELEEYVRQKYEAEPHLRTTDRRNHRRAPVRLRVKFPSRDVLVHDYAKDISKGGIFIQTQKPRKVGERFLLILVHPETNQEVEVMGEIVRITQESPDTPGSLSGMGIKFVEMDAAKEKEIEEFLGVDYPAEDELW